VRPPTSTWLSSERERRVHARPRGGAAEAGESIWVVAFPWGRNMMLARGIVSQVNGVSTGDRKLAPRLMVMRRELRGERWRCLRRA